MELFGSYYVIEHVIAEWEKDEEEKTFKIYITDMAKGLVEAWGGEVTLRFADTYKPVEQDTRTGDEIALEVINKIGLKVKTNGSV